MIKFNLKSKHQDFRKRVNIIVLWPNGRTCEKAIPISECVVQFFKIQCGSKILLYLLTDFYLFSFFPLHCLRDKIKYAFNCSFFCLNTFTACCIREKCNKLNELILKTIPTWNKSFCVCYCSISSSLFPLLKKLSTQHSLVKYLQTKHTKKN